MFDYYFRWFKWVLGCELPPPPAPRKIKIIKVGTFMATSLVKLVIGKPAKTAPDVKILKLMVDKALLLEDGTWGTPEVIFATDALDYDAVDSFDIVVAPICKITAQAQFIDAAGNPSGWSIPVALEVRDTTAPPDPASLIISMSEIFDVPEGGVVNFITPTPDEDGNDDEGEDADDEGEDADDEDDEDEDADDEGEDADDDGEDADDEDADDEGEDADDEQDLG